MTTPMRWDAPETLATILTTQLDGLTNGSFSAASAVIDNAADKYEWLVLEVYLAALSPAANGYLDLWIEYAADGSNYSDHGKALQGGGIPVPLDVAGATAQRPPVVMVPIRPLKFKVALRNMAGVNLAANSNTVKAARVNEAY